MKCNTIYIKHKLKLTVMPEQCVAAPAGHHGESERQ